MIHGQIVPQLFNEDMGGAIEWSVHANHHVLITHIDGRMDQLTTELDGKCTSMGAPIGGEIWFIPAGSNYLASAQGGLIRYVEIAIAAEILPHADDGQSIAGVYDALATQLAIEAAEGDADAASCLVSRLSEHLAKPGKRQQVPRLSRSKRYDLLRYIDNRLDQRITLENFASFLGIPINQFIHVFANAFGQTPTQFLIRQRIRRAQWHLQYSDQSIADIAYRTGFSSHAHLTNTFKNKVGVSPMSWRSKHMMGEKHA